MIERQLKQYRALNEWFKTFLGVFVAQEFTTELDHAKDYLKGETLLQLGNCGANSWLNALDFKHKWIASPFPLSHQTNLTCSLNQIPLTRNSIDCILIPLSLEPFASNMTLIDEIDRVVKPMGFIVFLSINPWSIWGGAMKSGLLHCFSDHQVSMRTSLNLNRIFLQRGYRQCLLSNFCYTPPVTNKSILKRLTFLEEVGKMVWPFPSGLYCYIAQKYSLIQPQMYTPLVNQSEYKSPLQPALNT